MHTLTFHYYHIPSVLCILAGIVYGIRFKKLVGFEKLILAIIVANIIADTASYFLTHLEKTSPILKYMKKDTHIFYNILIPVERILTLLIYAFNEHGARRKRIHYIGIAGVCLSFAAGLAYQQSVLELNSLGNILTGLVLAVLSYLHLRSISLNTAGQSTLMFYFGLANFVYFTLMISAMSALPLALQIDNVFANKIYAINLIAYALWSLILITALLWKNQKT